MMSITPLGIEAQHQVTKAFPIGRLAENKTHQLIPATKVPELIIASAFLHTSQEIIWVYQETYPGKNIIS